MNVDELRRELADLAGGEATSTVDPVRAVRARVLRRRMRIVGVGVAACALVVAGMAVALTRDPSGTEKINTVDGPSTSTPINSTTTTVPQTTTTTATGEAPDRSAELVLDVQSTDGDGAWVLTNQRLLHTNDGGSNWDMTPVSTAGSRTAIAALPGRAAVVASGHASAVDLSVIRGDGSRSHLATVDTGTEVCAVDLDYTDASQGFLLVRNNGCAAASGFQSKLFATEDGGQSWHLVSAQVAGGQIWFEDDHLGYLGAPYTLSRTDDGGSTWTQLKPPGWDQQGAAPGPRLDVIRHQGRSLVVMSTLPTGTMDTVRVFTSDDAGDSWSEIALPDVGGCCNNTGPQPRLVALSPTELRLFFTIWPADAGGEDHVQMYSSHDGGASWSSDDSNLHGEPAHLVMADATNGWVAQTSYDCVTTPCGGLIHRTTDGGKTWTAVTVPH